MLNSPSHGNVNSRSAWKSGAKVFLFCKPHKFCDKKNIKHRAFLAYEI